MATIVHDAVGSNTNYLPPTVIMLPLLLLQALALYMGHSIEMQRGTYDRRTKDQKVGKGEGAKGQGWVDGYWQGVVDDSAGWVVGTGGGTPGRAVCPGLALQVQCGCY